MPGTLAAHPSGNETLPDPIVSVDVSTCGEVTLSWTNDPTASGHVATRWHVQIKDSLDDEVFNNANYTSTDLNLSLPPGTYTVKVQAMTTEPRVQNSTPIGQIVPIQFEVASCGFQACSPGFWMNHPDAYTDVSFEGVFATGNVDASWMLSDALNNPGGTSPEPNPNNANFIGTGAYLSAVHPDVDFRYSTAEVVDAVQAAHGVAGAGGTGVTISDLDAEFGADHICPL